MTCMIQEPRQRLFLSEANTWTADFNQAREFPSIRESLRHKHALHLDDATVLVFRDKRVYRVEQDEVVPLGLHDERE